MNRLLDLFLCSVSKLHDSVHAAETEWEYFLSNVRILDSWLGRGFFQMFEAVLTLELSRLTAQGKTDFHKSLQLYRIVAGVSLLVCSALYILGGIFCWGRSKAKGRSLREACMFLHSRGAWACPLVCFNMGLKPP